MIASREERSASMTLTSGYVALEEVRLRTVTLNLPDLRSALRTGVPREPDAWES